MRIVATDAYCYDTRQLHPGDVFDATPEFAGLLKLIGKARDVTDTDLIVSAPEPKRRRTYRRRDLVPED